MSALLLLLYKTQIENLIWFDPFCAWKVRLNKSDFQCCCNYSMAQFLLIEEIETKNSIMLKLGVEWTITPSYEKVWEGEDITSGHTLLEKL